MFSLFQDPDNVRFEPALLPILPSDESVIVNYGFPALRPDQFREDEVIRILMDTPYNVKSVSIIVRWTDSDYKQL